MQYLSDDMDNLFRRASENYPLKTDSADWNKVLQVLHPAVPDSSSGKSSGSRLKKFLWLLVLVPISVADPLFLSVSKSKDNSNSALITSLTTKEQLQDRITSNKNVNKAITDINKPGAMPLHLRTVTPVMLSKENISIRTSEKFSSETNNEKLQTPMNEYFQNQDKGISVNTYTLKRISDKFITASLLHVGRPFPQNMQVSRNNIVSDGQVNPSPRSNGKMKTKKFYAGILVGPDFSNVKFQKIQNAGWDAGVLLGYYLNPHLSVETGIISEKKNYYTKGEYFNTSKIYLPNNAQISSVEGDCRMIEIPVGIRYKFKTGQKNSWSAAASASSYFMSSENYDYDLIYSNGQTANKYKSYSGASTFLLSVLQLSAGYSHSIKKFGDIKIEPYLKLPVSGLGLGRLPLMSTGIHIIFTRPVF